MKRTLLLICLLFTAVFSNAKGASGYVNVPSDGRIYYEVYGNGKPLIFLHGHTLDLRMWQPQIKVFANHYKVYVIDFRGYGKSSKLSVSQTVSHADDVIAFMDAMNIEKAHIVGLSMGGFVAGDLVGMFPERMLSCVMSSGAVRSGHPSVTDADKTPIPPIITSTGKAMRRDVKEWKKKWIEQLVSGGGTHRESIRKSITKQIMQWDGWCLTHPEPHLYYGREAMDSLKARRPGVPTLYISGEMEHKKRNGMLNYLPRSVQKEVSDCGHMSNMEQPEAWNKAVLEFLRSADN